jgi:hypothetical protein
MIIKNNILTRNEKWQFFAQNSAIHGQNVIITLLYVNKIAHRFPAANPTTSEFTATTPTLYVVD